MGIEPTSPAWKAGALPLSYTRQKLHREIGCALALPNKPSLRQMVEGVGFEPT